ncbi:uncharacterized protein LACBIDRAFT_331662 [Laccaria bicolor S238N-H82]|uniref:Predicted protein n=1 Tax=Laccaria bicolor (strain S238N-H82 / ATCC MYA-4686) TaxID=486041 RepID=B0DQ59_LACBS|nr:uncharacterized protein LACBIDRAFT_331662 [Laccaria bicolor S238N-H82]EDR03235.1 predicted protein [Laccaria bicolor S238N-H82]|eukprot:XP_001886031.1 predicted protein [Laccaria bicolor S238N-H82]
MNLSKLFKQVIDFCEVRVDNWEIFTDLSSSSNRQLTYVYKLFKSLYILMIVITVHWFQRWKTVACLLSGVSCLVSEEGGDRFPPVLFQFGIIHHVRHDLSRLPTGQLCYDHSFWLQLPTSSPPPGPCALIMSSVFKTKGVNYYFTLFCALDSSLQQPSPCRLKPTTTSSGFVEASAPHNRHSGFAESLPQSYPSNQLCCPEPASGPCIHSTCMQFLIMQCGTHPSLWQRHGHYTSSLP